MELMTCQERIKLECFSIGLGWAKYMEYQNGFIFDLL